MDTKINAWQCAKCGVLQPGPDLDLWMALCNCGVGAGQWGVIDLAAALKASEEQNGAIRRGLDWERAEREKVAEFARKIGRERDDLAAANLAANKRIVELEQETDRLITQRDHWEEQVGDMAASAGCEEEFSNWHDHKDCVEERVAVLKTERDAARAELARLTTPRPIAEAPRDGAWVLCKSSAGWKEGQFCGLNFDPPNCLGWFGRDNRELRRVTDYLPLPEVKP